METKTSKEPDTLAQRITKKKVTLDALLTFRIPEDLPHEAIDDHVKELLKTFQMKAKKALPEISGFDLVMVHGPNGRSTPFNMWPLSE